MRNAGGGRGRLVVAFDWDGTLLDSDYLLDQAIETVLRRQRADACLASVEPILYTARAGAPLLQRLRLPVQGRDRILADLATEYDRLDKSAPLFGGARNLLDRLIAAGVQLAILTGRPRASLEQGLQHHGLSGHFAALVCGGECPRKPRPDGLLSIEAALGARALAYVGNSSEDLDCAQAADTHFVGVRLCARTRDKPLAIDPPVAHSHDAVWHRLQTYLRCA